MQAKLSCGESPWVPRVSVLAWCLSQLERRGQLKVQRRDWSTVVTNIEDVNQQKRRSCRVQTLSGLRIPTYAQRVSCSCHPDPRLKKTHDLLKDVTPLPADLAAEIPSFLYALYLPLASTAGYALCHMSDKLWASYSR